MQLERIEVSGFRGISRLSLSFDQITTLLGENTWGKSSLLEALAIALPNNDKLYQFNIKDFHLDYIQSRTQSQSIQIITRWYTTEKNEHRVNRYRKVRPIWQPCQDDPTKRQIIYQVFASRQEMKVTTKYQFLDIDGKVLPLHHSEKLALEFATLHPVIHLQDARRLHWYAPKEDEEALSSIIDTRNHFLNKNAIEQEAKLQKRIDNTYRRLNAMPGHVNKGEIKSSLKAMQHLIEHYFSFEPQHKKPQTHIRESLFHTSNPDDVSLMQVVRDNQNTQSKLLLMGLMQAYLHAKGNIQLRHSARPILILEDPEGRLHPTNLLKSWELLQLIPMQKIITTNSGVLLSAVPLSSIRRLVRQSHKTKALLIDPHLLSKDEIRRISFHIRFHRPNALFARCWLLVEGETEVWLFNELAKIAGYNLAAEGVQIIEFAQSGLKSLIKIAKALNIDWHVVVDGDPAGKKYAQTVKNLLDLEQQRHRLTELPDRDIEHFLYHHGFESFFRELAKITPDQPIPPKKIIARVVKKYAKPDIGLGIVNYCETHGPESIPLLLRWILKRTMTMASGNQ